MATTFSRRVLDYRDWPAVIADVERLGRDGYSKVGRWDLSQTCDHLADWLTFPLDGFPPTPAPIRLMLWTLGKLVGRKALRKTLATRSMPGGAPTIPVTVHQSGGNAAEAVERLRTAISRFQAHSGKFYPSPIFGHLDRETISQLQLIHCAHHLSFLAPS
ncbi:MAG: DUF1569 domain-containing protein [Paludisphaera borealis]|uniref:DUF1569 domain-containing protein n=1 Tax=Paludisphaera borealis TaxID=1387353 RepID=UPI00283B8307|nr:DUF1569 domain-containing protein [Paludisphaera borealis]MDR3619845.1 DUF1569 domain-containing protein [Paludisphaera borealis]